MAKMIEDVLVLKLSKMVKDSDATTAIVTEDMQLELEQVAQELAGAGVLVEVVKA